MRSCVAAFCLKLVNAAGLLSPTLPSLHACCCCSCPTLQVALLIGDEMLGEEGALRAYNLLAPFLSRQDLNPLLVKALESLHRGLTAIKDTTPASLAGHSQQRIMAARATAAASYWLLRLAVPRGFPAAAGGAAGAVAGVMSRPVQPVALFAQLDAALLTALRRERPKLPAAAAPAAAAAPGPQKQGGKHGKAGSKQQQADTDAGAAAAAAAAAASALDAVQSSAEAAEATERVVELTAAQELVLLHPDAPAWAAAWCTAR